MVNNGDIQSMEHGENYDISWSLNPMKTIDISPTIIILELYPPGSINMACWKMDHRNMVIFL